MLLTALLAALLLAAPGRVAAAPAEAPFVLYYTVASPSETLTGLADRLLGDQKRAADLYRLNAGRTQPDGGVLTDPGQLRVGWVLVLPWDAVGAGVRYGQLPGTAAPTAPAADPTRPTGSTPPPTSAPSTAAPTSASVVPPKTTAPAANPTGPNGCVLGAAVPKTDWARERVDAGRVWDKARGTGVTVAVVDSGVDGSLPQFGDRVLSGADLVTGKGRGDQDCLGSGTAMAGLIAAGGEQPLGVAPAAQILPIRVNDTGAAMTGAAKASALEVAVAAGADVVALGAGFDVADPAIAEAIALALRHDVLVVAAAPAKGSPPAAPGDGSTGALLLVGAVNPAGALASRYPEGLVDVVAPGVDLRSLGIAGTGEIGVAGDQYAVALVAGAAALVRSAEPKLTAVQVKDRLTHTANRMGSGAPDAQFGWGMIDAAAAVTETAADDGNSPGGKDGGSTGTAWLALAVIAVVALGAVALFMVRVRRWARTESPAEPVEAPEPSPADDNRSAWDPDEPDLLDRSLLSREPSAGDRGPRPSTPPPGDQG
ncbi:S8 family serine peptidase [Dactylosporangium sp. CA-152071]|uniref:S8 family serine peptidase n=1 Tax=Dactylosporangium sp. CA-152071 TaxID=3239933 RepID=UPI003D8F697A